MLKDSHLTATGEWRAPVAGGACHEGCEPYAQHVPTNQRELGLDQACGARIAYPGGQGGHGAVRKTRSRKPGTRVARSAHAELSERRSVYINNNHALAARMAVELVEIREVLLDQIRRGPSQARQTRTNAGVDELASNIQAHGLLEPIHLAESERAGRYELIDGQRRLRAFRLLDERIPGGRFSRIRCFVYRNAMKQWEKKTVSLSANLCQAPMSKTDRINATTVVYDHFGSVRDTAKMTGLHESTIRRYVEISRLPGLLREAVERGAVPMRAALDAADIYGYDPANPESVSAESMLEAAERLRRLSAPQRKHVKEMHRGNPDMPVPDIVKKVEGLRGSRRSIVIDVASDTYSRIDAYREAGGIDTVPLAAADLVEDGLSAHDM